MFDGFRVSLRRLREATGEWERIAAAMAAALRATASEV